MSNSAFSQAVQIIGAHYPCGWMTSETSCPSSSNAVATGKQLWASENGSQDYNNGAAAMARADNLDYLDGKMTATINWPVVAALYPSFPYSTDGLILANQPWSGWYSVGKQLWVTAQTTQFTAPGWTYINSASGFLGGSESNGSYVTLKSPDGSDWSSIIETTQASSAQTVNYTVTGGLSTGTVHVWSTDVNSSDPSTWFVHSQDITPAGGSFSLTLQPGYVYSLTTTTGQGKGTATSPAQGSLALPYSDNFDSDTLGQQPPYLSQMQGAFEVEPCAGGRSGQCVQQQAPVQPIEWDSNASPFTIGGNPGWSNYTVSADALIEQAGAVQLIGRAGSQVGYYPPAADEYYLQLSNTGAWQVDRDSTSGSPTTLASGTVSAPGTGTWQHLALTFSGATITAAINGTTVATVTDSTYSTGMVGFGTSGYQTDQFDNLSVTPAAGSTGGGEHRPDHRRRRQRQVRGRQRPVQRGRHQDPAVGLQRRRQPAVDRRIERHPAGLRQVHGHHRRQLQQRHADRAVGLQRRRQPAMAGQQRRTGQPRLRQVPGRPQLQHRQRHPARPVDLQRRHQPAVEHPVRVSIGSALIGLLAGVLLPAAAAIAAPASPGPAQGVVNLYVAPGGRTAATAAATAQDTFASIAQAAPAAHQLSATSDVVVHLAAGTYRLTAPLRFTSADSGQNGHTITYAAASGDRDERLYAGDRVDAAEPGEQHLGGQRRHRREFAPAVRQRRRGAAGCHHRSLAPISRSPRPG